MKKFQLVILLSICIAPILLFAQKEDVVYLNNGSILRGKIIENVIGVSIRIEMVGRNVMVIPNSDIQRIVKDEPVPFSKRENKTSPLELTSSVNFYGGSNNSAGFNFITAYRPCYRLAFGAGLGIEWFEKQMLPFMADIKFYPFKSSVSPYIYGQFGYSIPLSKNPDGELTDYYGGVLAGTGVGVRFNLPNRNAVVFSLGYRYQRAKTIFEGGYWYYAYETTKIDEFNRMTFSMGFLFN